MLAPKYSIVFLLSSTRCLIYMNRHPLCGCSARNNMFYITYIPAETNSYDMLLIDTFKQSGPTCRSLGLLLLRKKIPANRWTLVTILITGQGWASHLTANLCPNKWYIWDDHAFPRVTLSRVASFLLWTYVNIFYSKGKILTYIHLGLIIKPQQKQQCRVYVRNNNNIIIVVFLIYHPQLD